MLLDTRNLDGDAAELSDALKHREIPRALNVIDRVSAMRTARIMSEAPKDTVIPFMIALEPDHAAEVMEHFPPQLAAAVLMELDEAALGLLPLMRPEKLADLLQHLGAESAQAFLGVLPPDIRQQVETLASFPPGSCGAVMSPSFLAVEQDARVHAVIEALRGNGRPTDRATYVYVLDAIGKLVGVISLRDLLVANPNAAVGRIMVTDVFTVRTRDDAQDAAHRIRSRHLKMLPVVDDRDLLRGVITIEHAMDLLANEMMDEFVAISAASPDESFFTPPREAVKKRLPWMAGNIFLNLGAVMVIASFEETIVQVAILAAFLPMITDMGGNVGIQALSVSIRSMALGEARIGDLWKAVHKEMAIGVFNGIALGALFTVVAYFLEANLVLGLVAGVALACNVLLAGVVGGTMPFLIRRLGGDPAMMTGPILTTITDITGVTIYLSLATVFLSGLMAG